MKFLKFIDENTSVPFKVVVPLLMAGVTATWYLGAEVHALRAELHGAWSIKQQQLWTAEMRDMNPGLRFPEPLKVVAESKDSQ